MTWGKLDTPNHQPISQGGLTQLSNRLYPEMSSRTHHQHLPSSPGRLSNTLPVVFHILHRITTILETRLLTHHPLCPSLKVVTIHQLHHHKEIVFLVTMLNRLLTCLVILITLTTIEQMGIGILEVVLTAGILKEHQGPGLREDGLKDLLTQHPSSLQVSPNLPCFSLCKELLPVLTHRMQTVQLSVGTCHTDLSLKLCPVRFPLVQGFDQPVSWVSLPSLEVFIPGHMVRSNPGSSSRMNQQDRKTELRCLQQLLYMNKQKRWSSITEISPADCI